MPSHLKKGDDKKHRQPITTVTRKTQKGGTILSKRKRNIFISVLLSFTTLLLGITSLSLSKVQAVSVPSEVKGQTISDALDMDFDVYMQWLESHESDSYYLGTPYAPYDRRNPNGDCAGAYGVYDIPNVPAMNCTGFVWHVLYKATQASGGNTSIIPGISGWKTFYSTNNISRRYFSSKEEMLSSGYLEKGDIIWMFVNSEDYISNYHHVGIYWGDGKSDVLWHSLDSGNDATPINSNVISTIIPKGDSSILYVVLKTGSSKIKLQLVKSSANPSITDGNGCYSLEGAQYAVYTSSDCSDSSFYGYMHDTDSDGYANFGWVSTSAINNSEIDAGSAAYNKPSGGSVILDTYYCKEITAPEGYQLDDTIYVFKDSGAVSSDGVKIYRAYNPNTNEQPKDFPLSDPLAVSIQKRDSVTGATTKLEGAVFRVDYYSIIINNGCDIEDINQVSELTSETLKKSWYIVTDEDGQAGLDSSYLSSKYQSDDFYYSASGSITIPLGTIVIQEIEAPAGYEVNETYFCRTVNTDGIDSVAIIVDVDETPLESPKCVTIKKQAEDNKIAGIKFRLHGTSDSGQEIDMTEITNEDGIAYFKNVPDGTYTAEEIEVPEWYITPEPQTIKVG